MAQKAQSYFLPATDEEKVDESKWTVDQKIQKFAIANRSKFMSLPGAVGVTSMKSNNTTAIILRVSKDFKEWSKCPEWIKKTNDSPKISDNYIKGYYNVINKETGNALTIDNEKVFLVIQSEEADINVESLKQAINDIGPTLKYPYYNYTKAQQYFIEFVESGNNNTNKKDANKQIQKTSFELRKKLMGINGVNGINVQPYNGISEKYVCITAKVNKNYKSFGDDNLPDFLKKCNEKPEFNDKNIKDVYCVLNEDGNDTLCIDDKNVLCVIKYYEQNIKSLEPASNNIGSTNANNFKNYTKPQGYFIDFDNNNDDNTDESKKQEQTLNSKIKEISINMRQDIRSIDGIIGVKTQICKDVGNAVIVARVNKTFKEWGNIPKILTKPDKIPKSNDDNIVNWYTLCDKDGNKIKVDDNEVLLCTYIDNNEIESLKSPQNKINPSKKSDYAKDGN